MGVVHEGQHSGSFGAVAPVPFLLDRGAWSAARMRSVGRRRGLSYRAGEAQADGHRVPVRVFTSASQTFRLRVSATCAGAIHGRTRQHDDELSPLYPCDQSRRDD